MALLGARNLAAGAGISRALNAIMRQFSGLNTEADELEARPNAPAGSAMPDCQAARARFKWHAHFRRLSLHEPPQACTRIVAMRRDAPECKIACTGFT